VAPIPAMKVPRRIFEGEAFISSPTQKGAEKPNAINSPPIKALMYPSFVKGRIPVIFSLLKTIYARTIHNNKKNNLGYLK